MIFSSQESRRDSPAEAGEDQEQDTHDRQTEAHDESEPIGTLEILHNLLGLRVGVAGRRLLNGFEQRGSQFAAVMKNRDADGSEDGKDGEAEGSAYGAEARPHARCEDASRPSA